MPRGRKPKRKNWVEKKQPPSQTCQNCGRKFWPKTDSDTCLLCLNGIIKPQGKNIPVLTELDKAKQENQKDKRPCLRCQRGYKGSKLVGELMIFEMNIPAKVIVSVIFA